MDDIMQAPQPEEVQTPETPQRVTVCDIQFRSGSKIYYFDPDQLELKSGDHVIIDTARGGSLRLYGPPPPRLGFFVYLLGIIHAVRCLALHGRAGSLEAAEPTVTDTAAHVDSLNRRAVADVDPHVAGAKHDVTRLGLRGGLAAEGGLATGIVRD